LLLLLPEIYLQTTLKYSCRLATTSVFHWQGETWIQHKVDYLHHGV
jgi:hypothetical protein